MPAIKTALEFIVDFCLYILLGPTAQSSVDHKAPVSDKDLKAERQETLKEAVDQLNKIVGWEDDRQKAADSKIGTAQASIGFIVALIGVSLTLGLARTPTYNLWYFLVLLTLLISVFFFAWAVVKIVEANDPAPYESRVAPGVKRLVEGGATVTDLQLDAMADLVSMAEANSERTNDKLKLYRAAIDNIRKAVITAFFVPLFVLAAYVANAFWGPTLPTIFQTTSSSTPSASPTISVSPTPRTTRSPITHGHLKASTRSIDTSNIHRRP